MVIHFIGIFLFLYQKVPIINETYAFISQSKEFILLKDKIVLFFRRENPCCHQFFSPIISHRNTLNQLKMLSISAAKCGISLFFLFDFIVKALVPLLSTLKKNNISQVIVLVKYNFRLMFNVSRNFK